MVAFAVTAFYRSSRVQGVCNGLLLRDADVALLLLPTITACSNQLLADSGLVQSSIFCVCTQQAIVTCGSIARHHLHMIY